MFAYLEIDSVLHRRNPAIKLLLVVIATFAVCFSYYPALPAISFVVTLCAIRLLGGVPLSDLLRRMAVFFVIGLLFIGSMLVLRGLDAEPEPVWRLGILSWSAGDLIHSITLGCRMLALVTLSMGFVLTTRPRDLVLSLILQCRVPVVMGYAAMATYRFLPELQQQVEAIRLAHEIRGIPWSKGIRSRLSSPFRMSLPLFFQAARRGESISCAMESRGLGRTDCKRTYMNPVRVAWADWFFLCGGILLYAGIIILLGQLGMLHLNFASIQ